MHFATQEWASVMVSAPYFLRSSQTVIHKDTDSQITVNSAFTTRNLCNENCSHAVSLVVD